MIEADLIAAAFQQAELDPGSFAFTPKSGPPTPLRSYVGEDCVLTIAIDDEGRRRNLVECVSREWAAQHGIDCPAVLGFSPAGDWLRAGRVRPQLPEGWSYVHAALDTADRIAELEPPRLPVASSRWRAGTRSRVVSAARGTLGGLDVASFLRSRRAAATLTDLTTCHGDFYRRNVLALANGRVSVVDWEFVSRAPRWTDHVRIWSTLRRSEDRAQAWERMSSDLAPERARHLRLLTEWMCHRLLAENLAAPGAQRDREDLSHARRVVAEARTVTAALR